MKWLGASFSILNKLYSVIRSYFEVFLINQETKVMEGKKKLKMGTGIGWVKVCCQVLSSTISETNVKRDVYIYNADIFCICFSTQ